MLVMTLARVRSKMHGDERATIIHRWKHRHCYVKI